MTVALDEIGHFILIFATIVAAFRPQCGELSVVEVRRR
jgi:hypothetical protein